MEETISSKIVFIDEWIGRMDQVISKLQQHISSNSDVFEKEESTEKQEMMNMYNELASDANLAILKEFVNNKDEYQTVESLNPVIVQHETY